MSIGGPDGPLVEPHEHRQCGGQVWWGCGGMSISGTGGASAGGQMSIGGTDAARELGSNVPKTTQELGSRTVYGKTEPLQLRSIPGKWIWGLMDKIINFRWGDYMGSMCCIDPYFPGSAQQKAPSKRG